MVASGGQGLGFRQLGGKKVRGEHRILPLKTTCTTALEGSRYLSALLHAWEAPALALIPEGPQPLLMDQTWLGANDVHYQLYAAFSPKRLPAR